MKMSDCSVLVGRPVEGPPRWMSTEDQGQLGDGGQAEGLSLQRHTRARCAGDRDGPGPAGTDGCADGRDLVFGLEGDDVVVLVLGQVMQDVAGGRDGVRALEERLTCQVRRCHKAQGQGLVARDVAVGAWLELGGRHLVAAVEELDGVGVAVAGLECAAVGLVEGGLELGLDPGLGDRGVPVEEPVRHAEGEEVLAAVGLLCAEAEAADRTLGELAQLHRHHLVGREAAVLQGVGLALGLLEIAITELVGVDDHHAAGLEVGDVGLERGRVHGHQHARRIAWRVDVAAREVDLET